MLAKKSNQASRRGTSSSRSGQAAIVIIFALMVGIIYLLLIPSGSLTTERKIERAANDIRNVVRSQQISGSFVDFLQDKATHRAHNFSYAWGQRGGDLDWKGKYRGVDKYSVQPSMSKIKSKFMKQLNQPVKLPQDQMTGCQLSVTNSLTSNYHLVKPYAGYKPDPQFYQAQRTHGFTLHINHTGLKITCDKEKSTATYQPSFVYNVSLPRNRFFVLANLSLEFLQHSAVELADKYQQGELSYDLSISDEETMTRDEKITKGEKKINQTINRTLRRAWQQSLKQAADYGFALNESKSQVNHTFNYSSWEIHYNRGSELRPKSFKLPVVIKDGIYEVPSYQGSNPLAFAFDYKFFFKQD